MLGEGEYHEYKDVDLIIIGHFKKFLPDIMVDILDLNYINFRFITHNQYY